MASLDILPENWRARARKVTVAQTIERFLGLGPGIFDEDDCFGFSSIVVVEENRRDVWRIEDPQIVSLILPRLGIAGKTQLARLLMGTEPLDLKTPPS